MNCIYTYGNNEGKQQENESKPYFNLSKIWIISFELLKRKKNQFKFKCDKTTEINLTHIKFQVLNIVTLMKTLQIVESSGNNIMSILQKAQMNDSEFVARTAFAQQMSCSNSQKNMN